MLYLVVFSFDRKSEKNQAVLCKNINIVLCIFTLFTEYINKHYWIEIFRLQNDCIYCNGSKLLNEELEFSLKDQALLIFNAI